MDCVMNVKCSDRNQYCYKEHQLYESIHLFVNPQGPNEMCIEHSTLLTLERSLQPTDTNGWTSDILRRPSRPSVCTEGNLSHLSFLGQTKKCSLEGPLVFGETRHSDWFEYVLFLLNLVKRSSYFVIGYFRVDSIYLQS